MTLLEFTARVSLALLLGGMIGAERQWRQRNAGLRTNTLVCVGSAVFVSLSVLAEAGHEGIFDPTRVTAQVVSGIGFLGAGVILREGLNVRGLNTAATLWSSAAVGTLCGAGFLPHATIGAGIILGSNVLLRPLAAKLNRQGGEDAEAETRLRIVVGCGRGDFPHVRALTLEALKFYDLTPRRLRLRRGKSEKHAGHSRAEIRVDAGTRDPSAGEKVLRRLSVQPEVIDIECRRLPVR